MSPFFVARTLNSICGKPVSNCKKLSDGTLLIFADKSQSLALQRCTDFGGVPVLVEPHRDLNTTKGVIFCWDLAYVTEEEFLAEMKAQGVIFCKKMKSKNGRTTSMLLTFETDKLPEKVHVGYNVCNVRAYIPNPLRCYNCHRFGHPSGRCKRQSTCGNCGQDKHEADPCPNNAYCVNCKGAHPASSRECPVFLEEKAIVTLKTKNKCSYPEAKKEHKRLAPVMFSRSFAKVASLPVQKINVSCQTDSVSCSVQTDTCVVETVITTDVPAQQTGGKGPNVKPPAQGRPLSQPLPPRQEKTRQRISPVRIPRRPTSVVSEEARKRASSVTGPRNARSEVPKRLPARDGPRPASAGSGAIKEPSGNWIQVVRKKKSPKRTTNKTEDMEVDQQPSTSGAKPAVVDVVPPKK